MPDLLILMAVEMQLVYERSLNWYLVNRVMKKGELVLILTLWGVTVQMLITFFVLIIKLLQKVQHGRPCYYCKRRGRFASSCKC